MTAIAAVPSVRALKGESMQTTRHMKRRHRMRGASAVEFAIVAPVLFFLVFAIVETCLLFWVNLTMQHATREGARYAITGLSDLDGSSRHPQRHLAVLERIKESSMGFYERVDPHINGVSYRNEAAMHPGMFGAPGQIFVLRIDCSWPVMTPFLRPFFRDGLYRFTTATTMRNEAY